MESPFWIDIEIEPAGAEMRVSARGSRGEHAPPQALAAGSERLEAFARAVGRAVKFGGPLHEATLREAQALHEALFGGGLRDLTVRLGEAAGGAAVLQRLLLRDRGLQAVPWEALCEPGTTEGFWSTSPRVHLARGAPSRDPWEPREVLGAVRLLAIAPTGDDVSLQVLRDALAEPIASGEIEWLDPIVGPRAGRRYLFDAMRRSKSPHILHYLGHGGVDAGGNPSLRLADSDDGEEEWIKVESLGREIAAIFDEDLRLVVLEACEGARPGMFGSAAHLLMSAGVDAVVAHLWPVQANVARACSTEFYRTLIAGGRAQGDVAASVGAVRRSLLLKSAEGFSPVLYLRGAGSSIFSLERRKVVSAGAARSRPAHDIAPALLEILEKPFSIVAGDGAFADTTALHEALQRFLVESGDVAGAGPASLSALAQRCALRAGPEKLSELFQDALVDSFDSPTPPLLDALARHAHPGAHVTLLWFPWLERALAEHRPDRNIHVIQPPLRDTSGAPRVLQRAAFAPDWKKEARLPAHIDLDADLVVLRLYGGYLPERRPIFTSAMITEDDHIHGILGVAGSRPPPWADELMARLRLHPGLFVGLSVLDWRHRMLLRWLYDQRPAPRNSLALLGAAADVAELAIWDSGGGLPGTGRIPALRDDLGEIAAALVALAGRGR